MPVPRYDFHIHTKYLGCGNATMEVADIVAESERLGVTTLAITDHLNALDRLPDHMFVPPEEIADVVMFLCGPGGRGICGQILVVDRGLSNSLFGLSSVSGPPLGFSY